ncbi:peroxide stress protein YaaA [Gilvimarinus agarilyticus]|uniref:peroxide stress protein YaaA n=1 Tax=Gilvimarinus sp. 2_MG-2023 TaxID=3062666 RepID=UPI001C0980BB|nr:peroxide stress protein YaaA [Gilvimarinus sp. 2_MG-2023]MBU2886311.1 peroxide stress protein YaaA [Gilvimarinus agarilyticus]MDO6570997.1 peroxide stress protein YaaA [Gilvimarinus sp. 2_MG-2023]
MLMVISPAKTLDFETPAVTDKSSTPDFLKDSRALIKELRELSPADISGLMSISDKLGLLNFDRFQAFKTPFTAKNAKQAVLAFQGDVYTGLNAEAFKARDFDFAQKHLRILSGLYGLLRPLDLIQPYRLEMGTKFRNARGDNLYQFWGESLTQALNQQLAEQNSHTLINLASNEYFKAVKPKQLDADIITPVFKDWKNGQYKIISFFAKKARGMMSAYIIANRIKDAEQIKAFDMDGYAFDPELSSQRDWVFTRRQD